MSKKSIKVEPYLGPTPIAMISCGDFLNSNITTVAWTGVISSSPFITYISLRKSRLSYELINESKEFCINLVDKRLLYEIDYCGLNSGRDINKFKELNLTKEKTKYLTCPMIKEALVSLECRVKEIKEYGSHDMIVCEVVGLNVDESYLSENDTIVDLSDKIITYSKKKYYSLDKEIGNFGVSKK